jgi:hypothetical protein
LGFGPAGSDPSSDTNWVWEDAAFDSDAVDDLGNPVDQYVASMLPEAAGTYDYAFRFSTSDGQDWVYADLDGSENGYSPEQAGSLTVNPGDDTTPPATPTGLTILTASPSGVELTWDAVSGDDSLYGYEVLRSDTGGGPYTMLSRLTTHSYTDTTVAEGTTYFYVVRALDTSFNRSENSAEVSATAELRRVALTLSVTLPASTDGTGRTVYIAGTLDRLDGDFPQWDPAGAALPASMTTWQSRWRQENTQIEYVLLGDWEHVERSDV